MTQSELIDEATDTTRNNANKGKQYQADDQAENHEKRDRHFVAPRELFLFIDPVDLHL
jgi:hypothetical protein